jgi:DNA-binding LacI/PurR family transcriptional regulator
MKMAPDKPVDKTPPPSRPPTSMDVARLAHVSRATVSYVLNRSENTRISEETKKRVRQAAASLGYIPHKIASSLRSGRSDLVLLPFFDWPYNEGSIAFLRELALQLDHLGYTVMLRFFGRSEKRSLIRKIATFHPVGMITVAGEFSKAEVDLLSRNGMRAILAYGAALTTGIPSVSIDFTTVGVCVGEYLAAKGFQRVAGVVPRDTRILHIGLERLEGLQNVASRSGMLVERVDLGFDPAEAALLAQKWKTGARPQAIFTYNDEYGMLLMSALLNAGLEIPAQLSLVGCDDLPLGRMFHPRLTTVNIDDGSPAHEIAVYFDRLIRGQNPEGLARIPLHCRLIGRESG